MHLALLRVTVEVAHKKIYPPSDALAWDERQAAEPAAWNAPRVMEVLIKLVILSRAKYLHRGARANEQQRSETSTCLPRPTW